MPNINIYENTKVVDLKKEERYIVITEKNYKINCKHVVIATHYPIINVPGYYFLKMYQSMSYLIAIKTNEKSFICIQTVKLSIDGIQKIAFLWTKYHI